LILAVIASLAVSKGLIQNKRGIIMMSNIPLVNPYL